jgi:hypothetical protein
MVVHKIEDGGLGDEIIEKRDCKDGPIREVEINLHLTPRVAKDIMSWLNQKLQPFDNLVTGKKDENND